MVLSGPNIGTILPFQKLVGYYPYLVHDSLLQSSSQLIFDLFPLSLTSLLSLVRTLEISTLKHVLRIKLANTWVKYFVNHRILSEGSGAIQWPKRRTFPIGVTEVESSGFVGDPVVSCDVF